MTGITDELRTFMKANGAQMLDRFNEILAGQEGASDLRIVRAKISPAKTATGAKGPTVEEIEGGYIIWK